jgi:uncharacterized protein YjiS (DUF1127 family)
MFRTLITRVRKWYKLGGEIARLESLDDILLADIGIDRKDISALVHGKRSR